MFSLNGTLKKVGRSGDGKRNNLLGWPNLIYYEIKLTLTCNLTVKSDRRRYQDCNKQTNSVSHNLTKAVRVPFHVIMMGEIFILGILPIQITVILPGRPTKILRCNGDFVISGFVISGSTARSERRITEVPAPALKILPATVWPANRRPLVTLFQLVLTLFRE